jgi:hypothetical protein
MKRKNNEPPSKSFVLSNVSEDEKSGCWNWTRSLMSSGYGALWNGVIVTGAHRVAFELWKHEIPHGAFVLHKCDNRQCCNPAHLFIGGAKENAQDMLSKGRHKFKHWGSLESPNAKLTEPVILEIRKSSDPHRLLAARYGVSKTSVGNLKRGKTYAEVV